jgi:hypothetical protein
MTKRAVLAIGVGGLVAGTVDITQALILFGWRVPLGISAALVGHNAVHNGPLVPLWILGLLLHFGIATTWTAAFYIASRQLPFMTEHPLVCGLLYGMVVELCMSYIVLPLSALHAAGPYDLQSILLGLSVHMVTVGLPIAYTVRYFTRNRSTP